MAMPYACRWAEVNPHGNLQRVQLLASVMASSNAPGLDRVCMQAQALLARPDTTDLAPDDASASADPTCRVSAISTARQPGRAPGDAEAGGGEHERACGQVRPAGGAAARGAARDQGRRGDHANQQERAARDEVVAYVPLQHGGHLVRLHARRRHLLEVPGHDFGS